jgi:putative copper export protein
MYAIAGLLGKITRSFLRLHMALISLWLGLMAVMYVAEKQAKLQDKKIKYWDRQALT